MNEYFVAFYTLLIFIIFVFKKRKMLKVISLLAFFSVIIYWKLTSHFEFICLPIISSFFGLISEFCYWAESQNSK